MRTLIAYVTKGGVTEESASAIADGLRTKYNLEVNVVNLKKNPSPDLTQYKNVIIGSGVKMQRVYTGALKFVEKNDFEDKRVEIFVSSLEPRDEGIAKYIKHMLETQPHVKPVAAEVFGGRMRFLGWTTADKRDIEKVRTWAEELGKKFIE